jgi:hypothetical protein
MAEEQKDSKETMPKKIDGATSPIKSPQNRVNFVGFLALSRGNTNASVEFALHWRLAFYKHFD